MSNENSFNVMCARARASVRVCAHKYMHGLLMCVLPGGSDSGFKVLEEANLTFTHITYTNTLKNRSRWMCWCRK